MSGKNDFAVISLDPDMPDVPVDLDEATRRRQVVEINAKKANREALEKEHGQVWDTAEHQRDFQVTGFMAPYCVVVRKSDGARGLLTFQHSPRFYWGFRKEG